MNRQSAHDENRQKNVFLYVNAFVGEKIVQVDILLISPGKNEEPIRRNLPVMMNDRMKE